MESKYKCNERCTKLANERFGLEVLAKALLSDLVCHDDSAVGILRLAKSRDFKSCSDLIEASKAPSNHPMQLSQVTTQYRSMYAAAKALNVSAMQLKRLVGKGALVDDEGNVYIKSTTKLEVKNEQSI